MNVTWSCGLVTLTKLGGAATLVTLWTTDCHGLYFAARHDGHASSVDARFLANRSSFVVPAIWNINSSTARLETNSQGLRYWRRILLKGLQFKSRTSSFVLPPRLRMTIWKTPFYDDFIHWRQEAWASCCPNSQQFFNHHHLFRRSLHPDLWLFQWQTT